MFLVSFVPFVYFSRFTKVLKDPKRKQENYDNIEKYVDQDGRYSCKRQTDGVQNNPT